VGYEVVRLTIRLLDFGVWNEHAFADWFEHKGLRLSLLVARERRVVPQQFLRFFLLLKFLLFLLFH